MKKIWIVLSMLFVVLLVIGCVNKTNVSNSDPRVVISFSNPIDLTITPSLKVNDSYYLSEVCISKNNATFTHDLTINKICSTLEGYEILNINTASFFRNGKVYAADYDCIETVKTVSGVTKIQNNCPFIADGFILARRMR